MRDLYKYYFKFATSVREVQSYFHLREKIFCQEQGLFEHTDIDPIDQVAYPIIAIHSDPNKTNSGKTNPGKIIGVVRIYESEPRIWYGGRLGVHSDYRRAGRIGKGLIEKAVTAANTWGCDRFLATVQGQNVRFFQRLHWNSLEEVTVCHQLHHLMEADLSYYPPCKEPRPQFSIPAKAG